MCIINDAKLLRERKLSYGFAFLSLSSLALSLTLTLSPDILDKLFIAGGKNYFNNYHLPCLLIFKGALNCAPV